MHCEVVACNVPARKRQANDICDFMKAPKPSKRILIVEDEIIIAMTLQNMLTRLKYSVTGIASTGESAIRHVKTDNPDLALVDIKLRGAMDGVDVALALGSRWATRIVFMTAYATPEVMQRALSTRPLTYILKPFTTQDVRSAIELAFRSQHTNGDLRSNWRRR